MTERCHYCDGTFANTKALGSHIHYMHEKKGPDADRVPDQRSEQDLQRFRLLLKGCLENDRLPVPPEVEKVQQALEEIPAGVSPKLDRYRGGFLCALRKEELMKEVEKALGETGNEH